MSTQNKLYRLYKELSETIHSSQRYETLFNVLKEANNDSDSNDSKIDRVVVDLDWVEAIEEAIPYIDRAIREQRRFISQTDEIVPIEKSRQITNESVRHLAQHTNMIASVEKDTVTPSSILNIYREENFAIYENRFLRTLLINTINFVEKRYKAITSIEGFENIDLHIERNVETRIEEIGLCLDYKSNYHDNNVVNINEDVNSLSDFQRVLRIRRILADFINAPLMKDISKSEAVRPPIMRTNLMTKDVNFKRSLDLWVFIESYKKVGYRTITQNSNGVMEEPMKNILYETFSFMQFLVNMRLDKERESKLEEAYKEENRLAKEIAEKEEEKRRKKEELRLTFAIQEATASMQKQHIVNLKEQENRLTSVFEKKIEELNVNYQKEIAEINNLHEIKVANLERDIRDLNALHQKEINELKEDYRNELETIHNHINELVKAHQEELNRKQEEYDKAIEELKHQYQSVIDDLNNKHNQEIELINVQNKEKIARLNAQFDDLSITYNQKANELKAEFDSQIQENDSNWEIKFAKALNEKDRIIEKANNDLIKLEQNSNNLRAKADLNHRKEVEALNVTIDKLRLYYEDKLVKSENDNKNRYELLKSNEQDKFDRSREKYEKQIADINESYRKKIEKQNASIGELNAKLVEIKKEQHFHNLKIKAAEIKANNAVKRKERDAIYYEKRISKLNNELEKQIELVNKYQEELKKTKKTKLNEKEDR